MITPSNLPKDYYLDNFHFLLDFVSDSYRDLLSVEEKRFCRGFKNLHIDASRLYVRLANRKGPYFRRDKIEYSNISDLPETIDALLRSDLARPVIPNYKDAVKLCSKLELMTLPELRDWPRSSKKADLVTRLARFKTVNPTKRLRIAVIELLGLDELKVFQLLFFGNFHQDMKEFVMHEIVAPFENYELSPKAMSFSTRKTLDKAIELKHLSDRADEIINSDGCSNMIKELAAELPERPTEAYLSARYDKFVNGLARQLERLGCHEEALSLYQLSVETPSRERRARLLNHMKRYKESIELCEEIEAQPLDQAEQDFARFFCPRVASRAGLNHALPPIRRQKIPTKIIKVSDIVGTVEETGVHYYQQKGARCFYVENTLFNGLFGLVFWDIIFSDVAGAFYNPFQRGPADLFTADFFQNRRSKFEIRLAEIKNHDELKRRVFKVFREKTGIANAFVYWSLWSEELLHLSLEHIPPLHWLAVFRRMLVDLRNNRNGFPDLVVFYGHGYELIELKGPGDKLQKNQQRWFQYFIERRIPASLVNVEC